jgi:hypothetical protein
MLAGKLAELAIEINSAAPEAQYQIPVERFIQTAARGIAATLLPQQFGQLFLGHGAPGVGACMALPTQ